MAGLGAVVVEAKLEVMFTGLGNTRWEEYSHGGPHGESYGRWMGSLGVWDYWYHTIDGVSQEHPASGQSWIAPGARVGFEVVGIRYDTVTGYLFNNPIYPTGVPNHRYVSFGACPGTSVGVGVWDVVDCTSMAQAIMEWCRSECCGLMLWPTTAPAPSSAQDPSSMTTYLQGLDADQSYGLVVNGPYDWYAEYDFKGQFTSWENMQVGGLWVRWRMPNGSDQWMRRPVTMPNTV